MKATQLAKRLKELTGAASYDEALAAVEQRFEVPESRAPVGITLVLDLVRSGMYFYSLLGSFESLDEVRALQTACRSFANVELAAVVEQAITASVSADKVTTE